ncbi:hypothetical protein HPB48_000731 [Haemaphysalis longicornis]|uniref:Uncharacterized protein n=1 Tax=Haemaphysalis longicornis TaxID=44386 RepID=A0A9J6GX72_HAELO|nr:hypothetical protein HPB48_000731 [Haemaphysalis longicornis]
MQSYELQRNIDVNILGTYKFIMLGISQIKRSEGRVVIVTGLHGEPSCIYRCWEEHYIPNSLDHVNLNK